MQLNKVGCTYIALDDLAALVHQEGGRGELDITPFARHGSGVVNCDLERQLARLREIHNITGRVVAHGHGHCFIALVFELVVCGHKFGHFGHTCGAAGRPKIHQRYFSLQLL